VDVARFKKFPLLGIIRGIESDTLEPLVETIITAGLETIEITMNTKGAAALISKAIKLSHKRLCIGAGTVLDIESLKSALSSGATFIVTPILVKDVLEYCLKNKVPVFPGGLTPKEIYEAWDRGATMVKVFPAQVFGPKYFKEIKGPFGDIELLACSGVSPDNLANYFENGASAVSFGASVFRKEWLENRDFKSISCRIKEYLIALKNCKI